MVCLKVKSRKYSNEEVCKYLKLLEWEAGGLATVGFYVKMEKYIDNIIRGSNEDEEGNIPFIDFAVSLVCQIDKMYYSGVYEDISEFPYRVCSGLYDAMVSCGVIPASFSPENTLCEMVIDSMPHETQATVIFATLYGLVLFCEKYSGNVDIKPLVTSFIDMLDRKEGLCEGSLSERWRLFTGVPWV